MFAPDLRSFSTRVRGTHITTYSDRKFHGLTSCSLRDLAAVPANEIGTVANQSSSLTQRRIPIDPLVSVIGKLQVARFRWNNVKTRRAVQLLRGKSTDSTRSSFLCYSASLAARFPRSFVSLARSNGAHEAREAHEYSADKLSARRSRV